MSFWMLKHPQHLTAIMDEESGKEITYGELASLVQAIIGKLPTASSKMLGFILCNNEVEPLIAYLAALQKKDAVCLLNNAIHHNLLIRLVHLYQPEWIYAPDVVVLPESYQVIHQSDRYFIWVKKTGMFQEHHRIHPDVAVLLSTSGTTGSPKLVKLSYKNIQANAESIAQYLELQQEDRPITTLPMHYSYGLSVIHSHFQVGATVLLTNQSVTSKRFWDFFRERKATSLAGVPFIYQMLERLKLHTMNLPSLRTLTQAGGRLEPRLVKHFHQMAMQKQWRFFVMYGQTEATARISYVPPDRLSGKEDSIGVAIPQGKLSIDEGTQELIYEGPNVMLGYANSREDLGKGDEYHGILRTGDLGKMDEDGFFYITGRLKRFIKLFGLRVNLDEVERALEKVIPVTVACVGDDRMLAIILENEEYADKAKTEVIHLYKLHSSAVQVKVVPEIFRTANGKIDYTKITEMVM
ncbi:AMP-binding protein [Brevibacillus sp. SYP-B805]|uniref:AMP-binding protein n=1 Tax=Brevibacillus sp. SYP-B805 TaxID=1578199 RepID=UPI0013ED8C22|nr:AMP-binding protein [Brevibacillus sp. SYP-B805]NGQ95654.1 AMP-binding protein [Brevibacillus sp. SYP-B805]